MNSYASARVGIVGFRGYSGAELLAYLRRHRFATPVLMEHRSDAGESSGPLGQTPPARIAATSEAARAEGLGFVLLATPADVSMALAPEFLEAGCKVIDLSGAFRLRDPALFEHWYQEEHHAPHLLEETVYGLPELYRERVRQARLVANPGCFPTAATLALEPLLSSQVVDRNRGVICDAKSGVSGAGRKPSLRTSFCEVAENFGAYAVLRHRHVPEVLEHAGLGDREFSFTTQLLPLNRGILETIYIRTERIRTAVDLLSLYEERYEAEPFVRLYAPGKYPDLRAVNHTNYCDIGFVFEPESRRAVVIVAIDNLGKGAAGQAIQNMNLMCGWPETEGLL